MVKLGGSGQRIPWSQFGSFGESIRSRDQWCGAFAKHKAAASYWQKGVEEKYVQRAYLAVLRGEISNDQVIHTYLGNDPHSKVFVKQRVTEKSGRAKQAETIFYPLIYSKGYTFCRVLTKTGRKHQIRVHAQWAGHPLVGEKLYGSDEQIYLKFCTEGWQEEWRDLLGMSRQALHGRSLHDHRTGKTFQAPLAPDIVDFIQTNLGVSNNTVEQAVRRMDNHFQMTTHKN